MVPGGIGCDLAEIFQISKMDFISVNHLPGVSGTNSNRKR
jgi:hypothetical protein